MLEAIIAVLFVQMEDRLAVALCLEAMPFGFEHGREFFEVVDLTVEYQHAAAIFVRHGHLPGHEIDDLQTRGREAGAIVAIHTFLVWAAMGLDPRHRAKQPDIGRSADDSSYATHFTAGNRFERTASNCWNLRLQPRILMLRVSVK